MKKLSLLIISILLFSFSAVCAQETQTEDTTLSFYTIGYIFDWGMKGEKVYEILKDFEDAGLEISVEQGEKYGKTISAQFENDDENVIYVFYFDNDTEMLYEIECITILSDDLDAAAAYEALIKQYGLDEAEPYENKSLKTYIADFDSGYVVAGAKTIAAIAYSKATNENYGSVALVFLDREYWES